MCDWIELSRSLTLRKFRAGARDSRLVAPQGVGRRVQNKIMLYIRTISAQVFYSLFLTKIPYKSINVINIYGSLALKAGYQTSMNYLKVPGHTSLTKNSIAHCNHTQIWKIADLSFAFFLKRTQKLYDNQVAPSLTLGWNLDRADTIQAAFSPPQ